MEMNKEDGRSVIHLPDVFTSESMNKFSIMIKDCMDGGEINLFLDMGGLIFMDSAGIGTLVKTLQLLRKKGGDLVLKNLSPQMAEFFKDTALDRLFNIQTGDNIREAEENLFEGAVDMKLDVSCDAKGDVGIINMNGMMNDTETNKSFKEKVLIEMADKKKFVLNLEGLTYLDSYSIAEMMKVQKILAASNGGIRCCCANELIRDLFNTLQISEVIPNYSSLEDALDSWR